MTSPDDMHSENIWFSWSKPSNYHENLRCHACDERMNGGKWKMEQYSVRPETAIEMWFVLLLPLILGLSNIDSIADCMF